MVITAFEGAERTNNVMKIMAGLHINPRDGVFTRDFILDSSASKSLIVYTKHQNTRIFA
jgi:hypothetical protein